MTLAHVMPDATFEAGYIFGDDSGGVKHPGVDLNIGGGDDDRGAVVRCFAPGVVDGLHRWDGTTRGFGNQVRVRHAFADGTPFWSRYCHLEAFASGLSDGASVAAGQVLGTCGKSGGWAWAHLHFQLEKVHLAPTFWPNGMSLKDVQSLYMDPRTLLWVAKCGGFPAAAPTFTQEQRDILALSEALNKDAQGWIDTVNREAALAQQIADLTAEVASLTAQVQRARTAAAISAVVLRYEDGRTQELEAPT